MLCVIVDLGCALFNLEENSPKKIYMLIGSKLCFYGSMETLLALAFDVIMVQAKRIYILIIKVNILNFVFLFLFRVFSKRNRKFALRVSTETLMKVWENSKKLWKHSPGACVPTAFLVLPNFHSCFSNSVETWYMFSISYQ